GHLRGVQRRLPQGLRRARRLRRGHRRRRAGAGEEDTARAEPHHRRAQAGRRHAHHRRPGGRAMNRFVSRIVRGLALAATLATAGTAAAQDIRLPDYQTVQLDNGGTLLLVPRNDVPMIAASVIVRGGSLADAAGKEGTADLLAEMLSKGAGERDALAFAQAVDGAGGSLAVGSSREAVVASAQFLSKDAGLMLSLLSDALLRPRMEQAEFDKLRKRAI